MSPNPFRPYFPAFTHSANASWVYLDSAATTQKLQTVIDITDQYYQSSVNVHRSSYKQASDTTQKFEDARAVLQNFIHAADSREIVWTKGATESINLLAACIPRASFRKGQNIVISALEHHANIVPWQILAQQMGLQIKVMPITNNGVLDIKKGLEVIDQNTALVAIGHVSNALGNINPVKPIIAKAQAVGALTVVDGTQAVSHIQVDVQELGCDFYVFSSHKMFGPTGVGVLYGKLALLEIMPPYQTGGEMIKTVSFEGSEFLGSPLKFEAGTPNIAGVLGFAVASSFIQEHRDGIVKQENHLKCYLQQRLSKIEGLTIWGDLNNKIATFSFTVSGVTHYDLGSYLNTQNISVRVGHHCAMPLMASLGINGTIRVSIHCYNTEQELDKFVEALEAGVHLFTKGEAVKSVDTKIDTQGELAQAIADAKSWDEKFRQIMLAGKTLPRLTQGQHTKDLEVYGCESQVWVKCLLNDTVLEIQGDSPSKIVRGLLAIIFEALEGKKPATVLAFDLDGHLRSIGLARYLSDSRANGIKAVVNNIFDFCKADSKN
ncbi:aminotransferase class V-fold PLP-dependent enzyme [uncultured Paraglaciecola sp.]|uniref:aminotransferase class V-fold PLP-dependent enzyme n=1 Tax=uncultured Paraglaciecola sp. TaxID=1765024 RepID=UPI0025918407|nr:aminotransferase class V-fold PLP-dependent enzyme [uncultured Paraglaciecola sp.]